MTQWVAATGAVLTAVSVVLLIGAGLGWFLLVVAALCGLLLAAEFAATWNRRRRDQARWGRL
jgi:hypothetical protein